MSCCACACKTARALSHLSIAIAIAMMALPGLARAQEAATPTAEVTGGDATAPAAPAAAVTASWPTVTVNPGLQMWLAVAPDSSGTPEMQAALGGTVHAHVRFADRLGAHVRFAYGGNSEESPTFDRTLKAMSAAAGVDFLFAIADDVIWYNTMGAGWTRAQFDQKGHELPAMDAIGGYFVTGFDVTIMDSMGVWMDWGCLVAGPASASGPAGDASIWHMNPVGAGGMRMGF